MIKSLYDDKMLLSEFVFSLRAWFYGSRCCSCEQRSICTFRVILFVHQKCLNWRILYCDDALNGDLHDRHHFGFLALCKYTNETCIYGC